MQTSLYFVRKHIWKNLVYIVTFVLKFFRVAIIGNAVTKDQRPYRCVLVLQTPLFGPNNLALEVDLDGNGLLFLFLYFKKGLQYRKNKSICYRKLFDLLYTRNQIYLLRNCFSNYVYLQDICITLKRIAEILSVSVLLICKFLNFKAIVTKKIKLSKVFI